MSTPRFQGDRDFARFLVDISLIKGKYGNTQDTLRGYSKAVGKPEAYDPAHSLHGFVCRILRNGYLEKSYYIEFRTNAGDSMSEVLVALTPKSFDLHGPAKFYLPLETKLNQIYTYRQNGGDYKEILNDYRQEPKTREKDLFSFQHGKFKNEEELRKHCQRLFHDLKFPLARVNGFFEEYRKHFDTKAYENPTVTAMANNFNANR